MQTRCISSARVLQAACTISALPGLFPCQAVLLEKIWVPADSPQAACFPHGRQAPRRSGPPDGRHRDTRPRGKFAGCQQLILRQFLKSPPALFHRGAWGLPPRKHAHACFVQAAEKPMDRTRGDPLAMMLAGTFVSGDGSVCDPLPQKAHAHPEKPRHTGDRPHLPLHGSQPCLNLSPSVANPVQNP